jgi:hypothetical protein
LCTPHAAESVLDLDLADDLVAVGLDLLEQLALGRDDLLQGLLEGGLGGGGVVAGGIGDDWADGGRLDVLDGTQLMDSGWKLTRRALKALVVDLAFMAMVMTIECGECGGSKQLVWGSCPLRYLQAQLKRYKIKYFRSER